MIPLDPDLERLYERAYLYGALHDSFVPAEAVRWANRGEMPRDIQTVARILALLRPHCADAESAEKDKGTGTWAMRPAARHHALSADQFDADRAETAAAFDTPIADARLGRGPFAPVALDRMIRLGDVPGNLARIAGALDRAGPDAPGAAHLLALRGILNRMTAEQRTETIVGDDFVGREAELDRIAKALANPQSAPPLRAIYISGMAGIGKSHLLERALQLARLKDQPVIVRLDFDRSGLDVLDAQSFFDEISRQVGDSLPSCAATLRDLRLEATQNAVALTRQTAPSETAPAGSPPVARLLQTMAKALNEAGKLLLIVLDTLEVLRSEGETRIPLLFERLDRLSQTGTRRIAIIAAGRGDAMAPAPDRILGEPLALTGLDDPAVDKFLDDQGVPRDLWPRLNRLAGGNPLLLKLAAKALAGDGLDAAEIPEDASAETVGGYLYRAILSRVPKNLRGLATEGLILPELDLTLLQEVIAPVVAPDSTQGDLQAMFDALRDQHWLVTEDSATGALRHRPDVRRTFLPLIYADDQDTTADINRRAADWYDRHDKRFEALYHRLQLTRAGDPMPEVPADLAGRFDPFTLDELPEPARAALRQAQGVRSDFGRAGQAPQETPEMTAPPGIMTKETKDYTGKFIHFDTTHDRIAIARTPPPDAPEPDPRALSDLDLTLTRADLREAEYVVQNALVGWLPATTRAGRLLMAHLWLTGRWSSARKVFDLQPRDALDTALDNAPLLQGRVLLDMTAEFRFDALVRRLRDPDFRARVLKTRADAPRVGLDGGALDFALLAAVPAAQLPRRQMETAFGLLAHNSGKDRDAELRLDRVADGLRAQSGFAAEHHDTDGLRILAPDRSLDLAILNPYAGFLSALLMRPPRGVFARFLGNAQTLPRAAADHYAPTLIDPDTSLPDHFATPRDLGHAFRGMGLAAEWVGGFTLFNPVADLPMLARALERWRRTVAGDWCYGRNRPRDWPRGTTPDRVTVQRAHALTQGFDPVGTAREQLFFWSAPTHDPDEAARHLETRFADRYARALATGGPDAPGLSVALGALHADDVPALAAAPLAVMASMGVSAADAFRPPVPFALYIPVTEGGFDQTEY